MITNNEINAVNLSPTKKDFYQIWNELLETASKISNRWDPTSTNEADPGIVLLKVLAALGDKLNYNVDKNILEAFMPSATQEESMRRLCDMLGYTMKYYNSATTMVNISYKGSSDISNGFTVDAFTNIKNNEDDINYFTLQPITLTSEQSTKAVAAIEGELCECESDDNNIISVTLLDDNYRYYLPEDKIAENGIFIQNYSDGALSTLWEKVDNLNTLPLNKKVYKFGYSSSKQRPYIQFPEDINEIIEDGLYIRYTRTHGINGNISANTLSKLEISTDETNGLASSDFAATNISAATNGSNPETINQAYNSYKKTIGTFDTLVTCRDYMNKIYNMITSDTDTTPLVSNVIVSDIRDDINRAVTLCTFSEYGMCYQDLPRVESTTDGAGSTSLINSFDLVLYPFRAYFNLGKKDDYVNSFKYSAINNYSIKANLEDSKTIAHNIIDPNGGDIACIKNYVKLNAKIVTVRKVNSIEEKLILANVYKALYNTFNMRMLEFGEPIPTEDMLRCIKGADDRIKDVYWSADPELYTAFCKVNGTEELQEVNQDAYDATYNKLAINNVLAGRISLFEYNKDFAYSFNTANTTIYPKDKKIISKIESKFTLPLDTGDSIESYTLNQNELIQFRAPNFRASKTYSAYVLYYFDNGGADGAPICSAGSIYQLNEEDKLYIKYTTTKTNSDGSTQSDTKYEYYTGKDKLIIRPNFDLKNRTGSSPANGNSFGQFNGATPSTIQSMYSLGANETIEVLEPSEVTLNKSYTYLYWHVNDEASYVENNVISLRFDEDNETAYTLKDGEYLCYTDINKSDLVVYTSGTRIRKFGNIELTKSISDLEVSAEEILTNGIAASIPWKQYNFGADNYLKLVEYQYITLGENNTLVSLKAADDSKSKLTGDWIKVNQAEYKYSKEDDNHSLPALDIENYNWEARSILAINMGPEVNQVLSENDEIKIYYKDPEDTPDTIKGTSSGQSPILNSNYICNTATGTIYTRGAEIVGENVDYTIDDFKIRIKEIDADAIPDSMTNNYGNNLTKVTLENSEELKLNIVGVDSNNYGLLMIYNTAPITTAASDNNFIKLASGAVNSISIYNLATNKADNGWWKGYHDGEHYYLRPGLNMIKFEADCSIVLAAGTDPIKHALIFDTLHIVQGINKKLDYRAESENAKLNEALKQIAAIDINNDFYYSAELDTANLIDLGSDAKLSTPSAWYDYNNINNKFVISELDAKYLSQGITLSLSSKL